MKPIQSDLQVPVDMLAAMPAQMRTSQPSFNLTGGLHAAALFAEGGCGIVVREDIGRHNAVDKVLGHALLAGMLPLHTSVLVVSGRVSFEIVQKAASAGVAIVVAVSAPSSLAVAFAREMNQTLAGFARAGRVNLYTHPERIVLPGTALPPQPGLLSA
jgi:FdhD protein